MNLKLKVFVEGNRSLVEAPWQPFTRTNRSPQSPFLIDLLAILQMSLDRALFLYNFIREVRSSGVRGSNAIMHIRKFFKLHHNIVRFRFFPRIAKRSIVEMVYSCV